MKIRTGSEFVDIIDEYLKEKKISRRQFCALIEIPNSTVASWKSKNVMPSVELVAKVARFMNVSLDWLVYGEIFENDSKENTLNNIYSRKSIQYRIEIILRQKFYQKIPDTSKAYESRYIHELFLNDIVEFEIFENWVLGKGYISDNVLPEISKRLEVPLQWLLTKDEYHQEDFDEFIYSLAIKWNGLIKGIDSADEEDQKFVDHYIKSQLERRKLKQQLNNSNND